MDALVAEDVAKRYGETVAVDGVSLSVEAGEVFALVGPNGAGKTTLVRALTGTTELSGGEASVFGESPATVDRARLGVLPQSFSPPARLTARELVTYYAGLYEESRDPDAVLADVGVGDAADTRYENLSGGQQRRTCLGITLVNDPDMLFLDEPTTGIDPAGRRTVQGHIADLAAGGATVFLTTHDMAEAERVADRVGFLAAGELVAVGTPAALVAEHGGERRLIVRTEAEPAALPLDRPATARDGELVVHGVDPPAVGDVVDALEAAGVDYGELRWTRPDLEDVYLELTGDREVVRPPATPVTGGDA
jgi:ABC-2 type transport system ATP-binding protein